MPKATLSFYEIPASDPDRLAGFFRACFGWSSIEVPWDGPRYLRLLAPEESRPPAGGILARDGGGEALIDRMTVMIDIEGESLETTLARVVEHGGTVALPPTPIGRFGFHARFFDPEGNSFGLWQRYGAA